MTTQESLKLIAPRLANKIQDEIDAGGWGPSSQMAWRMACQAAIKAGALTHRDHYHVSNHQPRSNAVLVDAIISAAMQAEVSTQSQHFDIVFGDAPIVGIPLRLSLNPTTVAFSVEWAIADGNATLSATDVLDPYITLLDTRPTTVSLKCSDTRGSFTLEKTLQALLNLDSISLSLNVPELIVGKETSVEIVELEGHEVINYSLEHNGAEVEATDDTGRQFTITPEAQNNFTLRAFLEEGVVSTDLEVDGTDIDNYKINLSFSQKTLKADKPFIATASTDFDEAIEGDMVWEGAPALTIIRDESKSNKAKISGPDGEHSISITVPTQYGDVGRTFVLTIGNPENATDDSEEETMTDPNKKDATDAQKDAITQDPKAPHPDVEAQATQNLNAHKDVYAQVETGSGPDPIAPNPNAPKPAEGEAGDVEQSNEDSEQPDHSSEINFDDEKSDEKEDGAEKKGSKKSK